ncbi:MAG: propionyl-CoA--succinate CoA transferase, partial [Gordonia sp. (in: high G+C Gram-positive bacteria)]
MTITGDGPVPPERLLDFVDDGTALISPIFAGTPETLIDALEAGQAGLSGVRVHSMGEYRECAYIRGEFGDRLRHVDYYLAGGTREAFRKGQCDLVPNHFSEMPSLLRAMPRQKLVIAGASMPDAHGYFTLG